MYTPSDVGPKKASFNTPDLVGDDVTYNANFSQDKVNNASSDSGISGTKPNTGKDSGLFDFLTNNT